MNIGAVLAGEAADASVGERIYRLAAEIFPICRSLTGPGVRETLGLLRKIVPLDLRRVPTGTPVLDWTAPKEWTIRDAWVKNAAGERVIDFRASNLHVMGYSVPVHRTMPLAELKRHLFSLPGQPNLIPYRTGYYAETWGFCVSQEALDALPEGDYEVMIDSSLDDGELVYGEYLHRGRSEEEFLLTTHCCHPSMANDNCSGLALLTHLAAQLSRVETRLSYRFLWLPGTIGAIAWLAANDAHAGRIRHGLVVSGVGDPGGPTYKRTRSGNAPIDRAMVHLLHHAAGKPEVIDFSPYGYDERQFNTPGYRLPVGLIQRSRFGTYPEYHTSADNLDFIAPGPLAESYRLIVDAIGLIETDATYLNTLPKGEPQLGRRRLYDKIGGDPDTYGSRMALLWLLNLSDGEHTLLDIAERSGLPYATVARTARMLEAEGLLRALVPAG